MAYYRRGRYGARRYSRPYRSRGYGMRRRSRPGGNGRPQRGQTGGRYRLSTRRFYYSGRYL